MQSLMASNALAGARGAYAAPNSRAKLNRRVAMSTRRPAAGAVTVRAGKTPDGPKVAIAGISGAVGTEFMRVRARPRLTRPSRAFHPPRSEPRSDPIANIDRRRDDLALRFFLSFFRSTRRD